jgi:hypothetical protein
METLLRHPYTTKSKAGAGEIGDESRHLPCGVRLSKIYSALCFANFQPFLEMES